MRRDSKKLKTNEHMTFHNFFPVLYHFANNKYSARAQDSPQEMERN